MIFIETAELDRMKVLAKDHPDMFYHILPYSMVFGLFDLYAKKLDALKLPAPDWYVYGGSDPLFPLLYDGALYGSCGL